MTRFLLRVLACPAPPTFAFGLVPSLVLFGLVLTPCGDSQ
jgi:hypothetical protein